MNTENRFRLATRQSMWLVVLTFLFASSAAAEWKEKVLYSFQGGTDGSTPAGGVVFDKAGNLYGATSHGGSSCPSPGCGTAFQLAPPEQKGGSWTETVLYGFSGNDGSWPASGLIVDASGNLYGTTAYGGSGVCILLGGDVGCGVVYELSPPLQKGGQWSYSILYSFQGGSDGQYPTGDLVFDSKGNLYGATIYGGGYGTCNAPYYLYCGTVFKLSPPQKKGEAWTEQVLHRFAGGTDGAGPNGGLVLDGTGAIYGTTYFGGNEAGERNGGVGGTGCGTVFKLRTPTKKGGAWNEKILYRFKGLDGANPAASVIFDKNGHLDGTTFFGGQNGSGAVFELAKPSGGSHTWVETVLYRFTDGNDGANPSAGLASDTRSNLYGTAYRGGSSSQYGDVFKLRPQLGRGNPGSLKFFAGLQTESRRAGNPLPWLFSTAKVHFTVRRSTEEQGSLAREVAERCLRSRRRRGWPDPDPELPFSVPRSSFAWAGFFSGTETFAVLLSLSRALGTKPFSNPGIWISLPSATIDAVRTSLLQCHAPVSNRGWKACGLVERPRTDVEHRPRPSDA